MPQADARKLELISRLRAANDAIVGRGGVLDLREALDLIQRDERVLGWRDFIVLAEFLGHRDGAATPPLHLLEFLAELAAGRNPRRLLDPCAITPAPLAACMEATNADRGLGLIWNPEVHRAAGMIEPSAEWRVGEPLESLDRVDEAFDFVVSMPPVALRPSRTRATGAGRSVRGEYAWALLLGAASRVTPEGLMAMLISEALHWRRDFRTVREQLALNGMYLSAVVSVGVVRGFGGNGEMDLNLALFGRESQPNLWVGRLTPDMDHGQLLENLSARRPGEVRELGRLIPLDQYATWRSLVAGEELESILAGTVHPVVSLQDVATVRTVSSAKLAGEDWGPRANTVYLPEWEHGAATTTPEIPEGRRGRYIELELDSSRMQSAYFAQWLNSSAGGLLRRQAATGTGIRQVSPGRLRHVPVPLPPLADQLAATDAERQLRELVLRAEELGAQLWLRPETAAAVVEEISGVETTDSFDAWLDRLPFPIAVIAHRYHADATDSERVERLLHFFEATAQFCASLLLSAVRRDSRLYETLRLKIAQRDPSGRPPLEHSTFGTWLQVGQTLAKGLRRDLQDPELRQQRLGLFVAAGQGLAVMLCGKDLWRLLDRARLVRNRRAHGGIRPPAEVAQELDELRSLLTGFRTTAATAFDDVRLVRPGPARIRGQSFWYDAAEHLTGRNDIFVRSPLRSLVPLDDDRLYLIPHTETISAALEMVPLFKLLTPPTSQQNAVYFYSGRNRGGGYDFVSYHFAGAPRDTVEDEALTDLLRDLESPS